MLPEIESFGHLMIARRAGGEPVGLVRSPDELVFLAFDASIKRLVELHILRSGRTLDSVAKKSAFERAKQASEIRGPTFMRILDVGEDQGLVYYTSNLNDGEFIEDYIQRRGPLLPAIVFSLVFQMLDDLIQLKGYDRLVSQMRLDRVVMTTLEDTFLHLRIYDYGLSSHESEEASGARLVIQVCELMFLMLTGKKHAGDSPDRYPSLTALPMSLRMAMRAALTDPEHCPRSLERLRDDVREAIGALVSGIQARNTRKQLVVIAALQPRSALQDLLLENVPVEIILGNRFRVEGENDVRRYPFSIPCFNTKNDQAVTVHLLPPSRIVDKTQYEAVPLQMWRFNADKHPNILRSLSLWESPDWTFLTEEREPGFALSRLLAERITLNHQEVAIVLRQVQAGQEQALECGVQRLDLHPSNILLRVGKNGPTASREHERLMQKRLDAWPPFQVKLRAHLTMRNLYEPPLVDKPEHEELGESHLADRDYRYRSFIALAAYLLTGQRQAGGAPKFPDATPELLADFVRECLEKSCHQGQAPSPMDFLLQFEGLMNATSRGPDLASRLRGASVPVEEMESVGSVSDFDDEWSGGGEADTPAEMPTARIARQLKPTDFSRRRSTGSSLPVWSAAAVVLLGIAGWWMYSQPQSAPVRSSIPPAIGEVMVSAVAKPVEAPAKPVATAPELAPTPTPVVEPKPVVASAPVPVKPAEVLAKPKITVAPPAVVSSLQPSPVVKPSQSSQVPAKPPAAKPTVVASKPAIPAPTAVKQPELTVAKPAVASKPATPTLTAVKPPEPAATKPAMVSPPVPTPHSVVKLPDPPVVKPEPQVVSLPPAKVPALPMDPPLPPAAPVPSPVVEKKPAVSIASAPPAPPAESKPVVTAALPPAGSAKPPMTPVATPTPAAPPISAELPPMPTPAPNSEVIRKAILPSAEEIARFKQGLANPPQPLPAQTQPKSNDPKINPEESLQRSGSMPTMNVAQPPPENSKTRQ